MAQWFGGRAVPMTGIAGVAVAPEARARAVGRALIRETLQELHKEGVALSALYPSTLPFYRASGYELAGSRFHRKAFWYGGPVSPLLLLLKEQPRSLKLMDQWMLRLVHLESAFSERGYPAGVEAELHLALEDPILPENAGNWILEVSGSRGRVRPGGKGELRLDVGALAALYSGYLSPDQLAAAGRLEGSEPSKAAAARMFAGTPPWLADFF
ncbi:MAG: GNAT family N-acetyltransferase [Armatimonadetes bacterium]|nr:GNAT family N-acetyltransferase [Armatimonadota bacterium]